MPKEYVLTSILVEQLRHGEIKKLTRAHTQAEYRREIGDNTFRADIFISLTKGNAASTLSRKVSFIAIEVKIKDWKQGLYQAWRYNAFAEKSYLALYRKHAHNFDIELFRQYNVGLIIFDETGIEVRNTPKHNKFAQEPYSMELRARLRSKMLSVESIQPAF
jgi:hypothetical protein